MSEVADQAVDGDCAIMLSSDVSECFKRCKTKLGADPPQDCEPSAEQFSSVAQLIKDNLPPYVD
eukprot:1379445-Amphidinium_carterae.1